MDLHRNSRSLAVAAQHRHSLNQISQCVHRQARQDKARFSRYSLCTLSVSVYLSLSHSSTCPSFSTWLGLTHANLCLLSRSSSGPFSWSSRFIYPPTPSVMPGVTSRSHLLYVLRLAQWANAFTTRQPEHSSWDVNLSETDIITTRAWSPNVLFNVPYTHDSFTVRATG